MCFSLLHNGVAMFNRTLTANGLMLVVVIPHLVSSIESDQSMNQANTVSLQHRRLGHISQGYLKIMKDKDSVYDLMDEFQCDNKCVVCSFSKNTKTPHNHTHP